MYRAGDDEGSRVIAQVVRALTKWEHEEIAVDHWSLDTVKVRVWVVWNA